MNDRLAGFAIAAFALAAPWSIAAAQTAVVLGILSVLIRLLPWGRRRLEPGGTPSESGFWRTGEPQPWPTRWPWTFRVIGLFLAIQVVSIVTAIDPGRSLQSLRGSWTYGFPILFFLLLQGRRDRTLFSARILVVSGALAGLYAIFQATTGTSPLDGEVLEDHGGMFMASGTLGHHLTFSGVMLPTFFLALGLAIQSFRSASRGQRTLLSLAVPAIAAGILLCLARAGWIGLSLGLVLFASSFGRRALVGTGLVLASLASLAYLLLPVIRDRVAAIGLATGPRFLLWESAWNIGVTHPWIGGGLGSWKSLFAIHKVPGDYLSTSHPHNDLLNVLVETGFVGAAVWIAIWVTFFIELRPRQPISIGVAVGVAALLLAGTLQCFITDEEVAQVWMYLIAVGLTLRGSKIGLKAAVDGGADRTETGPR